MATNYTTKTASLKATTADIRILNAKNITAENISIVKTVEGEQVTTNVSTELTSLDARIDAIENIQVNGVISDVTASAAAQAAGIEVNKSEGSTVREITVTTGEIKAGETKVVTGDAVNTAITAVKTVADTALQSASGDTYVSATVEEGSTEVKVSTDIDAIDTELVKETSEVGAAIKAAQDTADAAVKTVAKPAEGASTLLTVDQKDTAVTINLSSEVATKSDITTAIGNAKVVVAEGAGIEVSTSDNLTYTVAVDDTIATKEEVTAAQTAAEGKVTALQNTVITPKTVSGAGITVTFDGTVGTPVLSGSVTTASYTPATDTAAGSWTNEANVATASDVKAAIADVATAHGKDIQSLQTIVNGLTTTGLTREVLPDGQTTTDITNPKENVIYLVKDATSEAGSYIEYLYVGTGFEAIGSTKTDLSEYAKTADVNASFEATNAEVAKKANSADVYTKTDIDGKVTTINDAIEAAADKGQQGIDDAATAQAAADAAQDAADAAQETADAKIAAVEVTTDAETHFGAQHISAVTDDDKTVTINVTRSDEWSVGTDKPATEITSVINGKMSNGSTIDDANLIDGTSMFADNTNLTTYIGDLSKLTNGTSMFSGCTSLTTFVGNLGSLTDGTNMFASCELTEESLIYIIDSLPTVQSGTITVGVADGVDKSSYATEASEKGWTLD